MTKITLDEADKRTLKDVVGQACASHETIVVTGPQGEVARIVPSPLASGTPPNRLWEGKPVHDAEELARMTPEELKAIGWIYPDESGWVDEITSVPDPGRGKAE